HTVELLSREDFEIERFSTSNVDYRQKNIDNSNIWARYFPLMEFIGNVAAVSLLGFGGYLVIVAKTVEIGELVAFFSLVWYILGPLMNLGFVVNQFSQAKATGERLIEVLDAKEDIQEIENTIVKDIEGHVTLNDLTKTYKEEDDTA